MFDNHLQRTHRLSITITKLWRVDGLQRGMTAVVFGAYMFVLAMAASPALHQWLHDDADEANHQCAAVTAMQGQLDRPTVQPAVVASPTQFWIEPRPAHYALKIASLFLVVRGLEHAPPIGWGRRFSAFSPHSFRAAG